MTTGNPAFESLRKRKAFARVLDPFMDNGMRLAFDRNRFRFTPHAIREFTSGQFSQAFLDAMFPRWDTSRTLLHYTTVSSLASIAASGELRLYSISKRIGQGELEHFARDHDLTGYYDRSQGRPYFEELAEDLFYASFTPDTQNEAYLWNVFSDQGKGVRLKFRLSPSYGELRSIQYADPSRSMLKNVNKALKIEGLPPFLPWTISKIGGFYLQSDLQLEDEVRLLAKRHLDGPDVAQSDGTHEYWPIPIATQNDVCELELLGIELGPTAHLQATQSAIAGTQFQNTPII